VNSAGFRGREFSIEKSQDVYRIVMLGDSITFGAGVAQNETVPYFLEQLLSSRHDQTSYEVYNLGIAGYNTGQELATLREVGLKYQPDLVVLNICLNDSDPVREVWKAGLFQNASIKSFKDINLRTVLGASYFLTFAKYKAIAAIRKYHPHALESLNNPVLFVNKRITESAWSVMKNDMLSISRESLANDAQFVAVIYPYRSQIALTREELAPQNDLLAFFRHHGIKVFDAINLYKSSKHEMFNDNVVHLSAYGCNRVAGGILEFITDHGLIPSNQFGVEKPGSTQ